MLFGILGDMVYFNVFGQRFLVLGSKQRTTDLLEKRSSNYSDRERMPMLRELFVFDFFHSNEVVKTGCIYCRMNWDFDMGFLPYGVRWRKPRKLFHQHFHINAVSKYLPIQRREVHAFLRRLLVTPDDFLHHVRQ